jgi:glycosyltransferase involved in cell wall biosynthesis
MTTVSVVIPCHNGWDMVIRAIRSVLAQRDCDVQLIIVDDGSHEPMPAWIRDAAGPEAIVIRHEVAQGTSRARNAGIAVADGEWVAFLDHDDYWAPHKLVAQLSALADTPDRVWAYTNAVLVDEQLRAIDTQVADDPTEVQASLKGFNAVPGGGSAVMARTAVVRDLGGFDAPFQLFGDWEMWLRLAQVTPPACAPDLLTAYVLHGGSMSSRTDRMLGEIDLLRDKYAGTGLLAPDRGRIDTWIADRDRAAGRRLAPAAIWMREALRHRRPKAAARAIETLIAPELVNVRRRRRARRLLETHPHLAEWVTDPAALQPAVVRTER